MNEYSNMVRVKELKDILSKYPDDTIIGGISIDQWTQGGSLTPRLNSYNELTISTKCNR